MFRCTTIANCFFAGYGMVCVGTIIELTPDDAAKAIEAGRVVLTGM